MSSQYNAVPQPDNDYLDRGYGLNPNSGIADFARGGPTDSSPLAQSLGQQSQFHENVDDSGRNSSVVDDNMKRSTSSATTAVNNTTPSRSGTLKKKSSVRRTGSLKRSSSRKSLRAGSIRGFVFGDDKEDFNSAFWTPIPTTGTPTEVLADRFQAWRQVLKSLIAYFREVQSSYEGRSKALHKLHNTVSNITYPSGFISSSGIGEATRLLDDYHKRAITESNKSREIEEDVIGALTGLRSDLGQKIKEIKNLSGDFKNSVEKEKESTSREVDKLQAALEQADLDSAGTGKNDPYVVRLGVDRAVERQIDEENYLHRAYLNLESSGRELESIVVGEIQKAYKALAGILRREGDDAYNVVEELRAGPIAMPKDQEWLQFVSNDPHFVSPEMPLRRIEDILYPGKNHPAAAEIRAGMLERKSKYLKSYTAGWYVLSPTHLHEFKSADKIYTQPPVMSLYLGDQRLGSHSEAGSSSNKFMLKGKQAGGLHKGHNWVFRAESHDTMLAWFNDIKTLTEGTAGEKSAFVQKHTRSLSNASDRRRSFSSDGFEDDDADAVPYSADAASLAEQHPVEQRPQRPVPGGRFPSDIQVPRSMPISPASDSSGPEPISTGIVTSPVEEYGRRGDNPYKLDGIDAGKSTEATPETPIQRDAPRNAEELTAGAVVGAVGAGAYKNREHSAAVEDENHALADHDSSKVLRDDPVTLAAPAPERATAMQASHPVPDSAAAVGTEPTASTKSIPDVQHEIVEPAVVIPAPIVTSTKEQNTEETAKPANTIPEPVEPAEITTLEPVAQNNMQPAELDATPTIIAASAATTLPLRPTASVNAAPDAPAERATSTTAVKNAELVSEPPAGTISSTSNKNAELANETSSATSTVPETPMVKNANKLSSTPLGGLEAAGAHETGTMPKVVRHDTDISVSKLHVPGEFR